MDFNQAFNAYESLEGANCQTVFHNQMTQKDAAVQAVKCIGLNQVKDVKKELFAALPQYYEMFNKRLGLLKGI